MHELLPIINNVIQINQNVQLNSKHAAYLKHYKSHDFVFRFFTAHRSTHRASRSRRNIVNSDYAYIPKRETAGARIV